MQHCKVALLFLLIAIALYEAFHIPARMLLFILLLGAVSWWQEKRVPIR